MSLLVGLNNAPALNVKRRQPSTTTAIGINANEKSKVQNQTAQLRCVTDHDRFAGEVRLKLIGVDEFPTKSCSSRSIQGQQGVIIRMNKNVCRCLVKIPAVADELNVLLGEDVGATHVWIRRQCFFASPVQPTAKLGF